MYPVKRIVFNIVVIAALVLSLAPISTPVQAASTSVFINEIHYDNTGGDRRTVVQRIPMTLLNCSTAVLRRSD